MVISPYRQIFRNLKLRIKLNIFAGSLEQQTAKTDDQKEWESALLNVNSWATVLQMTK